MKTLTVTEAFPEHVTTIAASAASWFETWETPWLTDSVRLRFSTRLSRAVGRCYPARRIVSLADAVRGFTPRQVLDVLCHEFAHIAAYERWGHFNPLFPLMFLGMLFSGIAGAVAGLGAEDTVLKLTSLLGGALVAGGGGLAAYTIVEAMMHAKREGDRKKMEAAEARKAARKAKRGKA